MDVTFSTRRSQCCATLSGVSPTAGDPQTGRAVARRLLDVAAADTAALDRLPGAKISVNGVGEITVTFGQAIVIRGILNPSANGTRPGDGGIVITSLDVHGSEQR